MSVPGTRQITAPKKSRRCSMQAATSRLPLLPPVMVNRFWTGVQVIRPPFACDACSRAWPPCATDARTRCLRPYMHGQDPAPLHPHQETGGEGQGCGYVESSITVQERPVLTVAFQVPAVSDEHRDLRAVPGRAEDLQNGIRPVLPSATSNPASAGRFPTSDAYGCTLTLYLTMGVDVTVSLPTMEWILICI